MAKLLDQIREVIEHNDLSRKEEHFLKCVYYSVHNKKGLTARQREWLNDLLEEYGRDEIPFDYDDEDVQEDYGVGRGNNVLKLSRDEAQCLVSIATGLPELTVAIRLLVAKLSDYDESAEQPDAHDILHESILVNTPASPEPVAPPKKRIHKKPNGVKMTDLVYERFAGSRRHRDTVRKFIEAQGYNGSSLSPCLSRLGKDGRVSRQGDWWTFPPKISEARFAG